MKRPTVTVLMSVYNGQQYLPEAIESILSQSFTDFEFLVIDDGSEDSSPTIIQSYRDPRIRLIRNATNRGLATSLNLGIAASTGRYIARMDADDVSKLNRLAHQIAFMEVHPEVGICGSWVEVIGEGLQKVWEYPTDSDTIHAHLLFDCALAHPSVMFNRVLLQEARLFYDSSYPCAQDYELWSRAIRRVSIVNLPEVLLVHRIHVEQIGRRNSAIQQVWAAKVRKRQLEELGFTPTEDQLALHLAISTWNWPSTDTFVVESESWLQSLCCANRQRLVYPELAFSKVIGERWMAICKSVEPRLGRRFWSSPLSVTANLGWKGNLQGRLWRGLSLLGLDMETSVSR